MATNSMYQKMKGTHVYNAWASLRDRCNNPKNKSFLSYGGRGIKVCKRWGSFKNFYEDMGDPPEGKSLDRRDNDKGYTPSNCRWATSKEQNRNTRRNRVVCCRTVSEWAELAGISSSALTHRLNLGWGFSKALSHPIQRKSTYPKPLRVLASEVGIKESTLKYRLYLGWSLKKALTTPVDRTKNKKKRTNNA